MREHHLQVPKTARYWTTGDPEGADDVWFVLHGYMQLARRFLRRFEPIAGPGRLIVAPEGLSRFYVRSGGGRHGAESVVGASWMTREERLTEIADYVAYLDRLGERLFERIGRGSVRLVVLGFSQGVATAARWAVRGAWPADVLVAWGDSLPPDLDEQQARSRLAALDLVMVRGAGDATRRPGEEAKDEARLRTWGVEARILDHPGGHRVEEEALLRLAGAVRDGNGSGARLRTRR